MPTIASVSRIISSEMSSVCAVAPARRRPRRVLDHRARVGGDALLVEGGLREPPLAAVELALARQQPLAEQALRALERAPFLESRARVTSTSRT